MKTINKKNDGSELYNFAKEIFPIHRHLTGDGVRLTLKKIKKIIPNLQIKEIKSGTKCFDWTIPKEWKLYDAYILNEKKQKIVDIKKNNLHIVQYSSSINKKISYLDLKKKLFFIPSLPDAIPYVTSYYKKDWGFCITYKQFKKLNKKEKYHVVIKAKHFNGSLTYGELIIPGKTKKEVLLTSYICHPSMANNEISGPTILSFLAKWLNSIKKNQFTYRIVFVPETIGSIYYISKNLNKLKKNVTLGINLTCVGDDGPYSFIKTLKGDTYADKIFLKFIKQKKYKIYDFIKDRGSDERQYNHPNINIPLVSFLRTFGNKYKEYHTSLDNMEFISSKGLLSSYNFIKDILEFNEKNLIYKNNTFCEPFLTKYNLTPTKTFYNADYSKSKLLRDILYLINSQNDILNISNILEIEIEKILEVVEILKKHKLIKI